MYDTCKKVIGGVILKNGQNCTFLCYSTTSESLASVLLNSGKWREVVCSYRGEEFCLLDFFLLLLTRKQD